MKLGQHAGKIHSTGAGTVKLSVTKPTTTNVVTPEPAIRLPFTLEQFTNIKNLRYKNGEQIVSDNTKNNDIFYEIVNRTMRINYNEVYQFLTSKVWADEEDLYFNLIEFQSAAYKYNKFIESQFTTQEVVAGLYTCKFCKSDRTISFTTQSRSRDEGETVKVRCTSCNREWSIG